MSGGVNTGTTFVLSFINNYCDNNKNQHLHSAFCQKIQSTAACRYDIRKMDTIISLHLGPFAVICDECENLLYLYTDNSTLFCKITYADDPEAVNKPKQRSRENLSRLV